MMQSANCLQVRSQDQTLAIEIPETGKGWSEEVILKFIEWGKMWFISKNQDICCISNPQDHCKITWLEYAVSGYGPCLSSYV